MLPISVMRACWSAGAGGAPSTDPAERSRPDFPEHMLGFLQKSHLQLVPRGGPCLGERHSANLICQQAYIIIRISNFLPSFFFFFWSFLLFFFFSVPKPCFDAEAAAAMVTVPASLYPALSYSPAVGAEPWEPLCHADPLPRGRGCLASSPLTASLATPVSDLCTSKLSGSELSTALLHRGSQRAAVRGEPCTQERQRRCCRWPAQAGLANAGPPGDKPQAGMVPQVAAAGLELNKRLPGPRGSFCRLLISRLQVNVSLLLALFERRSQLEAKEVSLHIT